MTPRHKPDWESIKPDAIDRRTTEGRKLREQERRRKLLENPALPLPEQVSELFPNRVEYLLRTRIRSLISALDTYDWTNSLTTEPTADVVEYLLLNAELTSALQRVSVSICERLAR